MRKEVIQNIVSRRTYKPEQCSVESIEDEDIWEILKCANWAPTHGYTEPWRFVVFADEAKFRFSKDHAEMYKKNEHRKKFKQEKYNKIIERAHHTSHIIAVVAKNTFSEKIPFFEEKVATSMAVQNMQLAASAMSYGAFFYTGGMTYHDDMKAYLGFDGEDQVMGLLYLGIPDENGQVVAIRQSEVEKKVDWLNE